MYLPTLEFRADCADPGLGFIERAGRLAPPELSILSILHARKCKYRIEFLPPDFELLASPHETSRNQKRLHEINYCVRTPSPPLAVKEDPVEAAPFSGFT